MADADLSATSFEFYEGIRIVIPGAIAVGLAGGLCATFGVHLPAVHDSALGAVVLAVLIGLIFYYVDAPTSAAVFRVERPTDTMTAWKVEPPGGLGLLNVYFVILDTEMPQGIRARALYMGSMYRIGLEAIYLLGAASTVALLTELWTSPSGGAPSGAHGALDLSLIALAVVLLIPWAFFLGHRRTGTGRRAPGERSSLDLRALNRPDCLIVGLASALELAYLFTAEPVVAAVAASIAQLWAGRLYFRGRVVTSDDRAERLPLSRSAATTVGSIAFAIPLASSALHAATAGTTTPIVLWGLGAFLTVSLICARGHEKRLRGSYATQNTWLHYNRDHLVQRYALTPKLARVAKTASAQPTPRQRREETTRGESPEG